MVPHCGRKKQVLESDFLPAVGHQLNEVITDDSGCSCSHGRACEPGSFGMNQTSSKLRHNLTQVCLPHQAPAAP